MNSPSSAISFNLNKRHSIFFTKKKKYFIVSFTFFKKGNILETHIISFLDHHEDPVTDLPASDPVLVTFVNGETSIWEKRSVELRVFELTGIEQKIGSIIASELPKKPVLTCSTTKRQIDKIENAPKTKQTIEAFVNKNAQTFGYNYKQLCTRANEYLDLEFKRLKAIKELNAQLHVLHAHNKIGRSYAQKEALKSGSHTGSSRYNFDEITENLTRRSACSIITCVFFIYATILAYSLNSNSGAEL